MTNGQPQWGAAGPPPAPKSKPLYKNPLVVGVVLLVVLIAVIAISSGSAGNDDSATAASSTSAAPTETTTPFVAPAPAETTTTATATATPARNCDPAPDQLTAIISASFNDSGLSLGPAFAVNAPRGLIYIAANTLRGSVRESSGVVWVAKGSVVGALSSSARRSSLLPDGRDLFDANAGDEYGAAAIDCTIGSTN